MNYQDTSSLTGTDARSDADVIPAGSQAPAVGNTITGAGTVSGTAGADVVGTAPGQIVAIQGAGGADDSSSGEAMQVSGRYGVLNMEADGSYRYTRNGDTPDGVRDVFTYTLADSAESRDTATLTIDIGREPTVVQANAQQVVVGPDGVVTLPAGVTLADVHVVGRNLVIDLPDGTQMVIIDGAVFVPQLVLGGVEVPSSNLAALLIDNEPVPAAGNPQSSGGNFGLPPGPLDPGIPLGDLIPPVEQTYEPPIFEDVGGLLDSEPEAGTVAVQLDDDAKAGGNAGGPNDDPDSVNPSGFLPGSGGDGALTFDLLTSGAPAGFTYVDGPNGSILVQQVQNGNPVTVLTITVDPATGAYTVTQNAAIQHPSLDGAAGDNTENNVGFTINYTVTDQDGDVAAGTLTIDVDDDTPTIDTTLASDANVVLLTQDDETIGEDTDTDTTTANFGGIFGVTSSYGADGAGSTSTTYALSTTGGTSGLTAHGAAINLYLIGGAVVGSTAANAGAVDASNTIFDISVSATGVVTVNQYSQIDHTNTDPSPTGPGYEDHLISMADGAVTLSRTDSITDDDGDTITDTANVGIGANIRFADDGPSIDPTLNEVGGANVDESEPVQAATIALADGYTVGDDPHLAGGLAIGQGSTSGPVIDANAVFGADGPANGGGISYALDVLNSVSGLTTTEGVAINLVELSNGVVVGVVDGTTTVAFAISINSTTGVVTVEQYLSLFHPDSPNNYDEPVFLDEGSLGVTVTASDFDGDSVTSDAVDITSLIRFEDDGPSIDITLSTTGEPNLITQDSETDGNPTAQDTASANFAANFSINSSGGADGTQSVSTIYAVGVSSQGVNSGLTSSGAAIYLYNIGGVVVGSTSAVQGGVNAGNTIFDVSVVANSGTVTLTQYAQIDHTTVDPSPTGSPFIDHVATLTDSLVTLTATSTITDNDGDTANDSQVLNIGAQLQFQDDGPDISAVLTGTQIRIDETDGVVAAGGEIDPSGGNLGTVTVAAATLFTVSNVNLSADTPTTLGYTLTLSSQGVDSGLDLSTTNASIFLYNIAGTIYGSTSATEAGVNAGNTAFTVSIDSGTGAITLTQFLAVEHPTPGASHDEDSSGLAAGALMVNVTATDFDGDTDAASVDLGSVIRFEDDGPTVDVTLSTTAEPNLITQDSETDGNPTAQDTASASFAANFSIASSGGSDGTASLSTIYALGVSSQGVSSGLTSSGATIYLYNINGVVVGSTSNTQGGVNAGNTIFDVSVVANSGTVTLTQYAQIDHTTVDPSPTGSPFIDHVASLTDSLVTLTATSTITDNDGDTASDSQVLNIGAQLRFQDDGPDISAVLTGTQIRIDETDGVVAAGGEVDPVGGNLGTVTVAAATLFTVSTVNVSADTPTTTAYALTLSSQGVDSGLDVSSNNANIYLYNIGGTVYGSTSVTEGGVNPGNTAFTVSINATTGAITLTQFLAIEHPTPGASHDEDSSAFAANVLNVTVTATDFDGDTDAASVDLGSVIRFEDDGPSATNDTDSVSGGAGPATGNVLTGVEVAVAEDANNTDGNADNVGQDTPGTITFIASNNVPANTDGTYTANNLVVDGQYGTLTINANGDYSYTRTDLGVGGVSDVFTYTLTDADGDTVTATLTIGIEDAFPAAGTRNVVVDDDDVVGANGNPGTPEVLDDAPSNATGTLPASGGNGTLTRSFAAVGDQPALPAGFTYGTVDADTIQILQGGTLVLTIQITDPTTGAYTVTQNAPILHPTLNGETGDNTENNLDFTVNYVVTDGDGDTANGTMNINVDDDTPIIDVTKGSDAAVILTTDDAQTVGTDTDTAVSMANFSGVFGLTQSAGADGTAAAATLQYALDVTGYAGGPAGIDSGLNQAGNNIYLYEIGGEVVGSTSATLAGVNAGNTVFDVGVSGTGVVTLTQYSQIDHVGGDPTPTGSPFADHIVSLTDSLVTLTASASLTDLDGDTVTDSETVNIGANLRFTDDGPSAAIVESGQSVSVDESVGIQVDSNDTTAPAVVALFAGVANTGTDTHLPQYAQNASAIVASTGSAYGADGAGTTVFSLNVSAAGVDSGLNTTDGHDILLYLEGNLIVGRVSGGPDDGKAALAIAIDSVTGVISTVEYLSIQHPNAANPDDSVSIADGAVLAVVTVTDFDGDTATQQVGIGSAIQFQDSAPVMTAAENMNIQNSGDVANTAAFAFNLGADGAATDNNVITNVTGSATVGGVPVTMVLTPNVDALGDPAPETATTATYRFTFDYSVGGGATATATGTLVFNKLDGTYTIDLTSPIQGVTTILQTAQGTLFQGYEFGTSTLDGSQPEISVTQIQDLAGTENDIYVQFTSVTEPSSGTGDNNLEVTNWVPGADNPPPVNGGGDTAWNAGQLFNQTDGWVSTSNDANGVDGDTIQGGEVLDFSLVQGANPTGTLADPATYAQATAMFLKFDGIGTGEDMIVILKLYDPNSGLYTTRAIMVENGDIQKGPSVGPGQYSGITLDNNDGLVIIESNDYNLPGENWVIVGAQIAGSDEGITGTAIDLNSAIGPGGDSITGGAFDLDAAGFQSDTNDGPFKISSIGFLTTSTTPQNAQLTFDVTVTDGDGDSITQTVTASITAAVDSESAATIPAENTTVSMEAPITKVASNTLITEQQQAANTNSVLIGAIAGAGLMAASQAAAANVSDIGALHLDSGISHMSLMGSTSLQSVDARGIAPLFDSPMLIRDGGESLSIGSGFRPASTSQESLAGQASAEAPAVAQLPAGNDVPVASQAADAASFATGDVVMPSLEALMASVGQHGANAQETGNVAQVLADALAGGGGADIDALLAGLPGNGGNAVEALASHGMAAVSTWDMGAFGGYTASHQAFTMETLVLHQDGAVQQA